MLFAANFVPGVGEGANAAKDAGQLAPDEAVSHAPEVSTALAKYDPNFAAQQILGRLSNVTTGGPTLTVHAAERIMEGGPGRVAPGAEAGMARIENIGHRHANPLQPTASSGADHSSHRGERRIRSLRRGDWAKGSNCGALQMNKLRDQSDARAKLRQMLDDFISGRDQSKEHVAKIEALLIGEFRGTGIYEDLTLPVASYHPSGGELLYDAASLQRVFSDAIKVHGI